MVFLGVGTFMDSEDIKENGDTTWKLTSRTIAKVRTLKGALKFRLHWKDILKSGHLWTTMFFESDNLKDT